MANELSTNINEITQYIVIRIGEEQYGIDIKYIDNIVRMQQITRVPQVPAHFKGVINISKIISKNLSNKSGIV